MKNVIAYEKEYFKTVASLNISTVILSIDKSAIANLQKPYFMYSSNNCTRLSQNRNRYKSPCVCMQQVLNHSNKFAFNVGLPAEYNVKKDDKHVMTFLHILTNAIVTKDGDVYFQNIRLVPQRCFPNHYQIPKNVDNTVDEVFTIAQYFGYNVFHSYVENLSRISPYLDFLHRHKHIKIHIYDKKLQSNIFTKHIRHRNKSNSYW